MATTSKTKIVKWQLPELHASQLEVAKSKKDSRLLLQVEDLAKQN